MTIAKLSTAAAGAGLLLIAACTEVTVPTGDPNTRTNEGVGVGAATGALFGLVTGQTPQERQKRAIVGGILGAAVGGAIGAQLDRQAAELQASVDGRIRIINMGDRLVVRMPQDILFDVDSTRIAPALRADIAAVAASLRRYPNSTVRVVGHTDWTGTAEYNLDLSRRRAEAVASVLVANGISPGRIRTIGRGESQPLATNLTPEGRAQNRRVEIVIIPNG